MDATKSKDNQVNDIKIGDLVKLSFIDPPCVVVKSLVRNDGIQRYCAVTIGENRDHYWFIHSNVENIFNTGG